MARAKWKSTGRLRHPTLVEDLDLVKGDWALPDEVECALACCEARLVDVTAAISEVSSSNRCPPGMGDRDLPPVCRTSKQVMLNDWYDDCLSTYGCQAVDLLGEYVTGAGPPLLDAICPVTIPPPVAWDYTVDEVFAGKWAATEHGPAGHFYRDQSGKLLMIKNSIVVPRRMVTSVLNEVHGTYAHVALTTLIRLLGVWNFWWPELRADCAKFIAGCATCNLMSITSGKVFGKIGSRPPVDRAEEIAVDFTHLPPSGGYDGVIGVVDRASRYTMWIPAYSSWNARDNFHAIAQYWCAIYGFPSIVRSDNGANFASKDWDDLWATVLTKVSHSAPYHPQGNGIVERSFRTLKQKLKAIYQDMPHLLWPDAIPYLQGCVNSISRESLGVPLRPR